MSISVIHKSKLAQDLKFSKDTMTIYLEDGRILTVPLEWFPKLRDANQQQLRNWRFIGSDDGIHWEDLDEDVSVERLLD